MGIIYRINLGKMFAGVIFSIVFCFAGYGFCAGLFDAGVSFDIASPRGEFRDNVNRNGYGGSLCGLFKPAPLIPFKIGLEFGFINYGSESREEPFSTTIPDVTVEVNRSNLLTQ